MADGDKYLGCNSFAAGDPLSAIAEALVQLGDGAALQVVGGTGGGGGTVGGATEATLTLLLDEIKKLKDFEEVVLFDQGANEFVIRVRVFDQETETYSVSHKKLDNSDHTVVGPLVRKDYSTVLNEIKDILSVPTTGVLINTNVVSTTNGNVPANTYGGSVQNTGNTDGDWNGQVILAGQTIPWGFVNGLRYANTIPFDATGTSFTIQYTS